MPSILELQVINITIKFLSNILKNGRISNCDCNVNKVFKSLWSHRECNYDHIVHN